MKTQLLLDDILKHIPKEKVAVHFHDTYGQALSNILVALQNGINVIDAAVAGLGGCPYAKGASGNVATEDVVYMLNGMGIETGINLNKLAAIGQTISDSLGKENQSKVGKAILSA
jgi:hydroxymethylglutaryl-CoA lyase